MSDPVGHGRYYYFTPNSAKIKHFLLSEQLKVSQDRLLYLPRLDADISLGGCCRSVLQEVLHQGNIEPAIVVDLRCVEFPEAMRTDALMSQVVARSLQHDLDISGGDREDPFRPANSVPIAVVLDKLVQDRRNGEAASLLCFLLDNIQAIPLPIPDDVAEPEL